MPLSPEKLQQLEEIVAKIQDEQDRARFSFLIEQLMAVFEETERQKQIA